MSAFSDYLLAMNRQVAPAPSFAGILVEGAGPPDANTSPFFFFYHDTETGDIYFTPERDGNWEIALAGSYLDTDEGRLKVTL